MRMLTRRQCLKLGLGAGALALSGAWRVAGAGERSAEEALNMTVIPSTGERLPAVGLGDLAGVDDDAQLPAGLDRVGALDPGVL